MKKKILLVALMGLSATYSAYSQNTATQKVSQKKVAPSKAAAQQQEPAKVDLDGTRWVYNQAQAMAGIPMAAAAPANANVRMEIQFKPAGKVQLLTTVGTTYVPAVECNYTYDGSKITFLFSAATSGAQKDWTAEVKGNELHVKMVVNMIMIFTKQ
jgi:hypothetical protein